MQNQKQSTIAMSKSIKPFMVGKNKHKKLTLKYNKIYNLLQKKNIKLKRVLKRIYVFY